MPKPKTVGEYIGALDSKTAAQLSGIHKAIKSVSAEIEEFIGYGIPMYRYKGHLAALKAGNKFCSFVTMSVPVVKKYKKELAGFDISGTTIHFDAARKSPTALIKKIIKARMKENEEKFNRKSKKR